MSKHTKGKWSLTPEYGIVSEEGDIICQVYDNPGEEESEYNAALIAMAPELLRKSKEIISRGYLDGELMLIVEQAEGSICQ